ncbi:MAG: hypothetical protein JXB47_19910 [Anaerolineae bacterium]|nr:hypothetical protein [Anaerolineae bacterium]
MGGQYRTEDPRGARRQLVDDDPVQSKVEALEQQVTAQSAQSARAGSADALELGLSTTPPAYDGQLRFLTDKAIPAYGYSGTWRRFSDDSVIE